MQSLFVGALAFSLSQILLSLVLLLRRLPGWSMPEKLLSILLLSVAAYLIHPLSEGTHWEPLTGAVQTLVPGVFWLLCASIFDDHFRLDLGKLLLVSLTVVLPLTGQGLTALGLSANEALFYTFPQLLEFVLMLLALRVIVRLWGDDLVQARRDLRWWFCALSGFYIFLLLSLREVIFPGAVWLEVWQYVPLGAVLLITNVLLLQYRPGLLGLVTEPDALNRTDVTTETEPAAQEPVPDSLLQELSHLMEARKLYRQWSLTIGELAAELNLPEYRLRRIINAGLGYRNFNDFLNSYRVQEAGARLSDPRYQEQAILNIALDSGFRSLSSFNKAFKQAFGQTPSEFRNIRTPHAVSGE